jgi:hypothetical protein
MNLLGFIGFRTDNKIPESPEIVKKGEFYSKWELENLGLSYFCESNNASIFRDMTHWEYVFRTGRFPTELKYIGRYHPKEKHPQKRFTEICINST